MYIIQVLRRGVLLLLLSAVAATAAQAATRCETETPVLPLSISEQRNTAPTVLVRTAVTVRADGIVQTEYTHQNGAKEYCAMVKCPEPSRGKKP